MTSSNGRRCFNVTGWTMAVMLAISAARGMVRADDETPIARTPPRLSLIQGEVSFWRPNATDWERASVNLALAPGDQLYSAENSRLELQIGARAFVRGDGDTQLGVVNQEPDYLQLKLTNGRMIVDLRQLDRGHTVEVDTPAAAFTLDQVGFYRIDVDKDRTRFITRRGGQAKVTPSGGQAIEIEPNEEVVIEGTGTPRVATNRATPVDNWDRWNYDRTDQILAADSERYVPAGMYGTYDLDRYGSWRVVPTYGRVWVPASVAPGWAPYSTGRWIYDPYYGWTWVDDAPWGWAPYHYGRWVYTDSYWAWAPGPIAVAVPPVYAPALVAFFTPVAGVSVGVGVPYVSWVALGWGEPLYPWWGPTFFIGYPWWGGWCGPHHDHDDHHHHDGDHHGGHDHYYQNVGVHNAVVTARREQFHGGGFTRVANTPMHAMQPVHGALPIAPNAARAGAWSVRPPAALVSKPVTTARPAGGGPVLSSRVGSTGPVPSFAGRGHAYDVAPRAATQLFGNRPPAMQPPAPPRAGQHVFQPMANQPRFTTGSLPRGTFSAPAVSQPRNDRPTGAGRVASNAPVAPPPPRAAHGSFSSPGPSRFGAGAPSAVPPRSPGSVASSRAPAPYHAVPAGPARAGVPHFAGGPRGAAHSGFHGGARGGR